MKNQNGKKTKQLTWSMVKEEAGEKKRQPAKRVDIVSLRLVKESSLLYKDRAIRSPEDAYHLFKQFLGELKIATCASHNYLCITQFRN